MADSKLTNLPALTTPALEDLLYIMRRANGVRTLPGRPISTGGAKELLRQQGLAIPSRFQPRPGASIQGGVWMV